jgi:hypothetical protein
MTEAHVRTSFICSVAAFGLCVGVNLAQAQTVEPLPPISTGAPIYGGAETRNTSNGGLDLSIDTFEAYDYGVLSSREEGDLSSTAIGTSGFYSGLNVHLGFGRSSDRASFRSWANSGLAYYPALKDLSAIYHQVGLAFSAPVGRRVSVHGGPFADSSPRYSVRAFPGLPAFDPIPGVSIYGPIAAPAPDFDHTSILRTTSRYGASVGTNIYVSDRATVGFDYGYAQTAFEGLTDMHVRGAGAHFGFKLTRHAWLTTGYTRQTAQYEGQDPRTTSTGNINVGVHFDKALSITRRTLLRFSTGAASAGNNRDFLGLQAIGSASLVHQIGRTWSTWADYRRGLGYIEGYRQPVFSDTAEVGLGGLISRRVEFSTGARYFAGAVGLTSPTPPFDSHAAWARIRTGLTRTLAAYAEYRFYHYGFPDVVARPIGVPTHFGRSGVRVGLSLWVPLAK